MAKSGPSCWNLDSCNIFNQEASKLKTKKNKQINEQNPPWTVLKCWERETYIPAECSHQRFLTLFLTDLSLSLLCTALCAASSGRHKKAWLLFSYHLLVAFWTELKSLQAKSFPKPDFLIFCQTFQIYLSGTQTSTGCTCLCCLAVNVFPGTFGPSSDLSDDICKVQG